MTSIDNPISRTTLNFAQRRGFDITVWNWQELENFVVSYAVWFADNDDEPAFIIGSHALGEFTIKQNMQLNNSVWQQLPLNNSLNETELRQVFDYVFQNNYRVVNED